MCVSLLNHIKGSGRLLFVFIEKPMYEKCFIRITEQVGKKMSTYGTPRNAECLLNNTSSKHILIVYIYIYKDMPHNCVNKILTIKEQKKL
jgi:hypothetical protein